MGKKSFLGFFAIAALISATTSWAGTCTVDATQTNQYIHCIGASSAWSGIGSLGQALFADDNVNGHIGIQSLRARIDPNNNFSPEVSTLVAAKAVNPNILFWATEWSPPAQYKANNNVNGGASNDTFLGAGSGSPNSADTGLANYQVSFIQYCKNQGINLYALSIQNEPNFNPTYEACLWTAGQFDVYAQAFHSAIQSAGLSTKIMLPEPDNTFGMNLASTAMDDATVAPMIGIIGTHLYGTPNAGLLSSYGFTHVTNQEWWETEISGNTTDIPGALQEAGWIQNSLVDSNMNAFHYWWLTDLISNNNLTIKAYVLGNYSKFIRPGYYRMGATEVPSSGVSVSAFKNTNNSSPQTIVFVAINSNGSAVNQTFAINGVNVTSVTPWVTDSSNNLVAKPPVAVSGGSFTYSLTASSITSFVGVVSGTSGPTPTATPCAPTAITPFMQVNSGAWTQESTVTVSSLPATVNLGPQPLTGGSWSWTGPNGFTSTAREIDTIPLGVGTNTFTATYTNACGLKSMQTFTVTVQAPPTATFTNTNTPVPPTATFTSVPPTATFTVVPPTATRTFTAVPPTVTDTPLLPTPTFTLTPAPPTATSTSSVQATFTFTNTAVPPTATWTFTAVPPTRTMTPTNTAIATATNTPAPPTATNTSVPPTNTSTNTPVPPTSTFTPTVVISNSSFKVQLLSGVTSGTTNSPHPQIQIVNTGNGPLDLNNVTVRYWFNCDCTTQGLQAWVDWAGLMPSGVNATGNVHVSVQPTSQGGQTDYVLYSFTGNMVLQPGQTLQIQSRFNKTDWSNMTQSNDWSFAANTGFMDAAHVTGYLGGSLAWGMEPTATQAAALTASSVLAFPNPSTGNGTTLSFTLGGSSTGVQASDVSNGAVVDPNAKIILGIYTLAGRLIWSQTLTGGGYGSTGQHEVYWNEHDLRGTGLANGVYLLKVTVESNGQTTSTIGKILILG